MHDAAGVKPLAPIYDATLGPLKAWLVGAIQAPHRRGMMALAIAAAQRTIHAAARPWGHVAGPAPALLLRLARIGWSVTQPTVFTDRLGTRLDADEHGAFFLCHRARLDVAWWQSARFARAVGVAVPPNGFCLDRLAEAYMACRRTDPLLAASGLSVVLGRAWPQARAHAAGFTDSPLCLRCGAAVGSLHHRLWECPAQRAVAQEEGLAASQLCRLRREAAAAAQRGEATSFDRCLVQATRGVVRAVTEGSVAWRAMPPEGPCLPDFAFTDAAEVPGNEKGFVYAVVGFDGARQKTAHIVGECPSWVITASAAEAWAVYQALKAASPGMWLYSDSFRTIEAVERAKSKRMPSVASDIYAVIVRIRQALADEVIVRCEYASDEGLVGSASDSVREAHRTAAEYKSK